jgi:hypothetical protein
MAHRQGSSRLVQGLPGSRAVPHCAEFFKRANHPVALVTEMLPDPSVVQSVILSGIPIACGPAERLRRLVKHRAIVGRRA